MNAMRWVGVVLSMVACSDAESPPQGGSGGVGGTGTPSSSNASDASSNSVNASTGTDGSGGAGGGPDEPVVWGPCPPGFRDECATIEMPLDHANPDGEKIDVMIARHGTGSKQLWLLQGGPGGSAEVFFGLINFIDAIDPDLQVYTFEHRGVGDSTRLGCSAEGQNTPGDWQVLDEEWAACRDDIVATWGDRLQFFSATQAAHDLAMAIDLTVEPDQKVFIYGASYGTMLANRYAVLHPDQADGIILDAPFQPGGTSESFDLQFEPVGIKVFDELCPNAPRCAEHLGPDPLAFLELTFDKLATGHCGALGVDLPTWELIYGLFLMDYNLRDWLPALTYRLDRCSDADMNAIATLFSNIFGGGEAPRRSFALQVHIGLSEMWPPGHVDDAPIVAARENNRFYQDGVAAYYLMQDTWPRYAPDPRALEYAPAHIPFLTLAGQDDPATPPAITGYGFRDNLTGPSQTFVEIPYGAHTVLTTGVVPNMPSCPVQLIRKFLADPTSELPVGCAADVVHPSFDLPPNVSMQFFGTADLYD